MKKVINVCGAGRSGTTMLDLMLGNDDNAFSLGEIYAWFRPWRANHFEINCSCGRIPCPYWEKISKLRQQEFHKASFEILDVAFLIDSSKEITWVLDNNTWLRKANIPVINILLYKDPVAYIYSHWKRKRGYRKGIVEFTKYYSRFLQTCLPFIALNYQELVGNPAEVLQKICDIAGMDYSPGKEDFWTKQHHHLFGSLGTRKQVESGSSSIRAKEAYPVEFQEIIPVLQEEIKGTEIQNIMTELKKYDYKNGRIKTGIDCVRPWWYYLLKLRQKQKRFFPD